MTRQTRVSDRVKTDLVVLSCTDVKVQKLLKEIVTPDMTWSQFLAELKVLFPVLETDADLRLQLQNLAPLRVKPTSGEVAQLILEIKSITAKFAVVRPGARPADYLQGTSCPVDGGPQDQRRQGEIQVFCWYL